MAIRELLGPRIREGDIMLRFVWENAIVLTIVAAFTTVTMTLGYVLLDAGSRFVY